MYRARYPESLEIFVRHGLAPLRNPVVRRTMARVVTLKQACRREGADPGRLLAELRAPARKDEGTGEGMPVACPAGSLHPVNPRPLDRYIQPEFLEEAAAHVAQPGIHIAAVQVNGRHGC